MPFLKTIGQKIEGFKGRKFFAREPSGSVLPTAYGGGPIVNSDFAFWICVLSSNVICSTESYPT
jgi:hypothetical protein